MYNSQKHTTGRTPEAQIHLYKLNEDSAYYEKESGPIGFNKLPYDLKVEKTQKPDQIHANLIIRSRLKNGKYKFFTGMKSAGESNWFYGDHVEFPKGIKKKSFILFQFSQDQQRTRIHFFNQYFMIPKERERMMREYIEEILRPRRDQ